MNRQLTQLIALALVCCLGQFSIDIISPSIPAIANSLHISINAAQWSMVLYLLSYSLSPVLYGPLAEHWGRKKPLCFGIILLLLGSAICAYATSLSVLLAGRLLQGLGGGACMLWRSIFRDCFQGDELAKMGSYLGTIIIFIAPAAPLLGGHLQSAWGWQASFIFTAIYAAVSVFIVTFVLNETLDSSKQVTRPIIQAYLEVIKHSTFLYYVLATCLTFGAFFAWFVVGPVLWIHVLKYSSVSFGELTCLSSMLMMFLAGLTNGRLVTRWGRRLMLRIGWSIIILAGLSLMALTSLFGLNGYTLFIPISLSYFGSILIFPNINASAFTPFGHIAGYAAAVYALGQSLGGFFIGGLMAHLPDTNAIPLGLVIVSCAGIAWLVYEWRCNKPQSSPEQP